MQGTNMKMDEIFSFESSVNFYGTNLFHIEERCIHYSQLCKYTAI